MSQGPIQINLKSILRSRGGALARIPVPIVKMLAALICQNRLNEVLATAWPRRGGAFAKSALETLHVEIKTRGEENIPPCGRFIFASNHPLGGLDGIALISILAEKYGNENFRFLVNDMLMNVEPLADVFLPINKFGAQGRQAAKLINEAYASDMQIAIFPAGLVSRLGDQGIRDLDWQKAFVSKAIEFKRDIIPIYFKGLNKAYFYKVARWRKRLGIKINLEQILLPRQLCKSEGKSFEIMFGKPITWQSLRDAGRSPSRLASDIKEEAYRLSEKL